jgi:regulator of sigma E protease
MTLIGIMFAVIALGILIFVHELGHFLVAKFFKVGVEKFSLGFGPKIIGKKFGETEYLLSALPLGGYVKMVGEGEEGEVAPADLARSFASKTPWQRIAIVAAGPIFNLFFALVVFIAVFMVGFPSHLAKVKAVTPGKAAEKAGIQTGDVIVAVNDVRVASWEEMREKLVNLPKPELKITVRRGDQEKVFILSPEIVTGKTVLGDMASKAVIGIESAEEKITRSYDPGDAIIKGSEQTWDVIKLTYVVLWKLVMRTISWKNIGSPIMIAVEAGNTAQAGAPYFLAFLALLSVNLGVLNLLPIPILDGGHIVFNLWEVAFRRPLTLKAREIAQQVGLFLLLALMFVAFYNDILRYFFKAKS